MCKIHVCLSTAMETEDLYGEEEAEKMEQEVNVINSNIKKNIMLIFS